MLKNSLYWVSMQFFDEFLSHFAFPNDDSLFINFQQQRFCSKVPCIDSRYILFYSYVRQIYRVCRLRSASDHKIVFWRIFVFYFTYVSRDGQRFRFTTRYNKEKRNNRDEFSKFSETGMYPDIIVLYRLGRACKTLRL